MHWDVSHWGIITIPDIVKFCNENGLERTKLVVEHNDGQLYLKPNSTENTSWVKTRKFRGVSVIYAPDIKRSTSLHFFWDGDGSLLRDYVGHTGTTPPEPNRSRSTTDVISLISPGCEKGFSTRFLKNDQVPQWQQIIQQLNEQWGIRNGGEAGALPLIVSASFLAEGAA